MLTSSVVVVESRQHGSTVLYDIFADADGVTPLKTARSCSLAGISCKRRATVLWANACVHDRQEHERRTCRVPGG